MFRKKTCVNTFLDENEAPRITDPTYISHCATMITYSDLEIESCQLTGGDLGKSKLDRRVAFH